MLDDLGGGSDDVTPRTYPVAVVKALARFVPTRCAVCAAPGDALCAGCRERIGTAHRPPRLLDGADTVSESVAVLGPFEAELRTAIHAAKYRGAARVLDVLAGALATRVAAAGARIGAVVGVPSQRRNVRARGYDQAIRLAGALAAHLDVAHIEMLVRVGSTRGQTHRGEADRRSVSAADFELTDASRSYAAEPDARIVVADDVITTGSTLRAATVCVRSLGVATMGAAIAYTPRLYASGSRVPDRRWPMRTDAN